MFGPRTRRRYYGRAVGAALLVLAAAGCSSGGSPSAKDTESAPYEYQSPSAKDTDDAPYEYQLQTFSNGHVQFSFRLGPGEEFAATPVGASATPSPTDPVQLTLTRNGTQVAAVTAYAADAPLPHANTGLDNGRYGIYRTAADIAADELAAATHEQTALGDATVFTHPYGECTNSCKHWTVPVAVITLAHPKDPGFPTLVLAANHGEIDVDGLRSLLTRLAR